MSWNRSRYIEAHFCLSRDEVKGRIIMVTLLVVGIRSTGKSVIFLLLELYRFYWFDGRIIIEILSFLGK